MAASIYAEILPDASGVSEACRLGKSIQGSRFVLIRSCEEFEPEWLRLLGQLYEKPIVPVGLLPPLIEQGGHTALDWLDKQEKGSVLPPLSAAQVQEIALGLELSQLPFVWALRAASVPDGLVETLNDGGRGLICVGWVPQVPILAHPSVGGYLTHAGWSSIVEALAFGRVMAVLPLVNDQGLNARHLVEKGIGVEVPRNEDGSFTGDGIAKSLRLAMVEDEGEGLRAKAKEWADVFGDLERNDVYVSESIERFKRFVESGSSV